jgi:hypothetical protein
VQKIAYKKHSVIHDVRHHSLPSLDSVYNKSWIRFATPGTPFPEIGTLPDTPLGVSVSVSVPEKNPDALGTNCTLPLQLAPGANVAPHGLRLGVTCENVAPDTDSDMFMVAAPLFVSVNLAVDVLPTGTGPKL